ncbi:G patch domain-containing protein 1 homolog [Uranotaenia lowii]|uniref:G patch domain-containing protein 1 homolog n=1 Tax=Uranotaenia lowii TaxID=190385 RepID=UPI002479AFB4|nr:G patch domain-containing protein 1 homolog [Uranotaenia lowii]
MSDNEESLCKYGTPLPAYDEDDIPSKKPISVEDQIVLDVNGKRRFHGAFTGGFSAGYWNTVGSAEGWTPTEFKSSRTEKSVPAKMQTAMDFMDDEDLSEFGIAPQRVQARDDFAAAGSKRRIAQHRPSDGPIPGQPVLRALLEPAKEKTVVRMLKQMGWREGQGIGERQTRTEKKKAKDRNQKEKYVMKMYGCELPGTSSGTLHESDTESDLSDNEVTFAPDDFDPFVASVKINTFGLGYTGLARNEAPNSQRFNLFETLEVVDRNNKKLSIRGQAFGIGALEDDDDEDIYFKDDMSKYDFSLESSSKMPETVKSKDQIGNIEGFCAAAKQGKQIKKVFRVTLPENFVPRNWSQRRTRFEPVNEVESNLKEKNHYKIQGLGRHDHDPKTRGAILGEVSITPVTNVFNQRADNLIVKKTLDADMSANTKSGMKDAHHSRSLVNYFYNEGSTKDGFKPFLADAEKQERYEKFVLFKTTEKYPSSETYLNSLQPLGMSTWDREREFKEFVQAQRMYRPLDGLMSDRFVTESNVMAEKESSNNENLTDIKMKRTKSMWKPSKDLCKRFNVPEPFGGLMEEEKIEPKAKFSVFDYLEAPTNTRANFVTPVVVPKQLSKPTESKDVQHRRSARDFFVPKQEADPKLSPGVASRAVPVIASTNVTNQKSLSQLEQQVLDSVNKKPEDKKDLFKSIFCSSDEEEEPISMKPADATQIHQNEKLKLIESFTAIKPASQLNVLRNNSPPRGIFKSILELNPPQTLHQLEKTNDTQNYTSDSDDDTSEDDGSYGPKLPSRNSLVASDSNNTGVSISNNKLDVQMLGKSSSSRHLEEEWVEKNKLASPTGSKSKKKKHKEHKKSKKHKKDKKKLKHKDKR